VVAVPAAAGAPPRPGPDQCPDQCPNQGYTKSYRRGLENWKTERFGSYNRLECPDVRTADGVRVMWQRKGGNVHAFLLDDPAGLTLFDTLFDTDAHRVLAEIEAMGRQVTDLRHIVISHAHRSHIGGLATLKRLSGAAVLSHAWEADVIAGDRESQRVPIRPQRPVLAYAPVYYLQFGAAVGFGKHPPCLVDESIREGTKIGSIEVVHTPGHTPGHVSFWWPERGVLLAGDAIATYPLFSPGWPAFNLNLHQARDSLHKMIDIGPSFVGVGHGDPLTEDATEKLRVMVKEAEAKGLLGRGPG